MSQNAFKFDSNAVNFESLKEEISQYFYTIFYSDLWRIVSRRMDEVVPSDRDASSDQTVWPHPRDSTFFGVWSGSVLFVYVPQKGRQTYMV